MCHRLVKMVFTKANKAYLQGQVVLLPDIPSEINDSLHALHLPLDHFIEVLFLDVREHEEVN